MVAVSPKHECPCVGCTVMLPRHLLMCRPHWRRVPRAVAAEVNDAWRAWQREPTKAALIRYTAARSAAIVAVDAKIATDGDWHKTTCPLYAVAEHDCAYDRQLCACGFEARRQVEP